MKLNKIYSVIIEPYLKFRAKSIIKNLRRDQDLKRKYANEVEYLINTGVDVFPYDINVGLSKEDIIVYYDVECDLNYLIHDGNKKLYFKREMSGGGR